MLVNTNEFCYVFATENGQSRLTCVPTIPTFPTFSYFLIQSPTFPYFLGKQPYYPYFLGCHVVELNKEHLKHVILHWFSTLNIFFVDKKPLTASSNVYFGTF